MGKHKHHSKFGFVRETAQVAGIVGALGYTKKTSNEMKRNHVEAMQAIQAQSQQGYGAVPAPVSTSTGVPGYNGGVVGTYPAGQVPGAATAGGYGPAMPAQPHLQGVPQAPVPSVTYNTVEHHYYDEYQTPAAGAGAVPGRPEAPVQPNQPPQIYIPPSVDPRIEEPEPYVPAGYGAPVPPGSYASSLRRYEGDPYGKGSGWGMTPPP